MFVQRQDCGALEVTGTPTLFLGGGHNFVLLPPKQKEKRKKKSTRPPGPKTKRAIFLFACPYFGLPVILPRPFLLILPVFFGGVRPQPPWEHRFLVAISQGQALATLLCDPDFEQGVAPLAWIWL